MGSHYPTYTPELADPEQQKWLEETLAESDADYVIVGGHYPVYSVCEHGTNVNMVANLQPLLEKYEVGRL